MTNKIKIVTVAGLIGIGLFAIKSCCDSLGEEVYRGPIGGFEEVVYQEGKFFHGKSLDKNVMDAKKENITYHFEDIVNETRIAWRNEQSPEFEKDSLERVSIKTDLENEDVNSSDINLNTIDGIHKAKVISDSNKIYNDLRRQIREKLRSDYQARAKSIEDNLK